MDENVLVDEKLILQQPSPSILEYWLAVKRCHRMVIIIAMTAVTVAAAFVWIRPYRYTASARLQLRATVVADKELMRSDRIGAQLLVESQIMQRTLPEVVSRLDLARRWGTASAAMPEQAALEQLRQKVTIGSRIDPLLTEVFVTDSDRATAIDLAQAIVDVYSNQSTQDAMDARRASINGLTEELSVRQAKVMSIQKEAAQLKDRLSRITESGLGLKALADLQQQLTRVQQEQVLRDLRVRAADQLAANGLFAGFGSLVGDQAVGQHLQQITKHSEETSRLHSLYGPSHNLVQLSNQKAEFLSKQLEARVAERLALLQSENAMEHLRIDGMQADVTQLRKTAAEEADTRAALSTMTRTEDREQAAQAELEHWIRDLSPNVQPVKSPLLVIEQARIVQKPLGQRLLITLSTALVIGIGLGITLAVVRDRMDRSFKHMSDIERRLRLPVMGVIGLINRDTDAVSHKDAFRVLRNQVEAARSDRHFNSLCLVSAGAGEGKSATVANLAAVWTELGLRVLVVDTDTRRPTLHKLVGGNNEIGVAEYCASDVRIESIIQPTEITGVSLIAAGRARGDYGHIIPGRIAQLAREVTKRFDLVLYDTPASLQIGDATIVAREIGNCLFVVQHHGYPQHMGRRAVQMLRRAGARFIGVAVNKVRDDEQNLFFGYSSEYYYPQAPTTPTRAGVLLPISHHRDAA